MLYKKYRLLVCVEYNGSNYIGWQKQCFNTKLNSIQNVIENVLSVIAKHKISIFCSSRTDSGVHSLGQVFHFDTFCYRSERDWLFSSNNKLPYDISFRWVKFISSNFHARFNAISRRYFYVICTSKTRSCFFNKLVTYYNYDVNINLMKKASKYLLGENDFSSFKSSKCESLSSYRNIIHINIYSKYNYIFFDIRANSFFYHMVRNIVSSLLLVGIRKYSFYWIKDFLNYKDNSVFKINMIKPYGLYLFSVYY